MSTSKTKRAWIPFDWVELVCTLICLFGLFAFFHANDLYLSTRRTGGERRSLAEDVCRTAQRLAERFENQTFDLRLQARAALRPTTLTDRLVLLTVDDHSVEQYGRWPWPRGHWARVMEALGDVGAAAVAFDILFSDPSPDTIRPNRRGETFEVLLEKAMRDIRVFLDPAMLEQSPELFGELFTTPDPAKRQTVFGGAMSAIRDYVVLLLQQLKGGLHALVKSEDDELAEAIRSARERNVPTFAYTVFEERRTTPEALAGENWSQAVRAVLDGGPGVVDKVLQEYSENPELPADLEYTREDLRQDLVLALLLQASFDRREEDLATDSSLPLRKVLARSRRLKELIIRWALAHEIDDQHEKGHPRPGATDGERDPGVETDPRSLLRQVFARLGVANPGNEEVFYLSLIPESLGAFRFRQRFELQVAGAENLRLPDHKTILTTVPKLLELMEGSGSGNAHYDADGTMRRLPLIWSHEGRLFPHLGLSIGMNLLGAGKQDLEISSDGRLRLTFGESEAGFRHQLEIPIDREGRLIVPWGGRWDGNTIPLFNVGPLLQYGFRLAGRDERLSLVDPVLGVIGVVLTTIDEKELVFPHDKPVPLGDLVSEDTVKRLEGTVLGDDEAILTTSRTLKDWKVFLDEKKSKAELELLQRLRVPIAMLKQVKMVAAYLESKGLETERCRIFKEKLEIYLEKARKPPAGRTEDEWRALSLGGRALVADTRRIVQAFEEHASSLPPEQAATDVKLGKFVQTIIPAYREQEDLYSQVIERVDSLREDLVDRLRGKICLIGDIQTSGTDFAPTPLQDHYPKVGLQANTISSVLTGSAIRTTEQFFDRHVHLPHPLLYDLVLWSLLPIALLWILPVTGILRGNRVMLLMAFLYVVFCVEMLVFHDTWIPLVGPVLCMFGTASIVTVRRYVTEEWMKRRYRRSFETMVDPKIVDAVMENQDILEKLGGANYEVTAFFSDVAGFTTISEMLKPDQLAKMLTEYLTPMTDIIVHDFGGTRDKYIGDAIVAFWGAPLPVNDHATRGCLAALLQVERIKVHRAEWLARKDDWYLALLERGLDIDFRIGLNTGVVKVGSFGSKGAVNYTMIGDAVNLAARLEGANKPYGTQIMISENTYAQAHGSIDVRELDILQVKGKLTGVKVYEVLAAKGKLDAKKAEVVDFYHKGLGLYRQKRWDEALVEFEKALAIDPTDGPSLLYQERVQDKDALAKLPDDWSGVYVMTTK